MRRLPAKFSKRTFDNFLVVVDNVIVRGPEEISKFADFLEELEGYDWPDDKVKHVVNVPEWLADKIYDGLLDIVSTDQPIQGSMAFTINICLSAFAPVAEGEPVGAGTS